MNEQARIFVKTEVVAKAHADITADLIKRILTATTPEDREARFQEYQGFSRLWVHLEKLAVQAEK